jgi:hypothetical protein
LSLGLLGLLVEPTSLFVEAGLALERALARVLVPMPPVVGEASGLAAQASCLPTLQ